MELVFEMLSSKQFVPTDLCQKTFTQSGGVIGRGEDCDWVIPDRKRHLSSHHAMISYREGAYYLTDTSSNGIHDCVSGSRLIKGEALRIETGSIYGLGDFEIHARLSQGGASFDAESCRGRKTGDIIPDDVFLDLDPLQSVDQQEHVHCETPGSDWPGTPAGRTDHLHSDADASRAAGRSPVARPETVSTRVFPGSVCLKQGLEPHARRPLIHLSLCADYPQLVIRIEAGVQCEKLVEDRSEHKQIALADIPLRVDDELGAQPAHRQSTVQPVDMLMLDRLQSAEQPLADFFGMLVVVARQVVGFENQLQRIDVSQGQIVERHVADQLPEEVPIERRRKTWRDRRDVAKTQEPRRQLAGLIDVTEL